MASRVIHNIEFDRPGRQVGYLRVPQSRNLSGWGTVEVPLGVVAGGTGPTVLITAGVHGDEYDGQVAVARLLRSLRPDAVQGRVILLPAVDLPACLAMTRLCPFDGRDLNRVFPGNPDGTFTERLAHFIDTEILPLVDISLDLHTGGSSMNFVPSTNMHFLDDPQRMQRALDAAAAFGAPYNVVFHGVDESSTLTSAVERRGILSVGTELGGYARASVEGIAVGERGAANVLKRFGVIEGQPDMADADGTPRTRHMQVRDMSAFTFAPAQGLFEPRHTVGERVESGDIAGYIHFVEDVDRDAIDVRYQRSGILWATQGPGRPMKGDTVAVVMEPFDPSS